MLAFHLPTTVDKEPKFKGRKLKFTENDPRLQLAFKLYIQGATEKDVERQTGINRRTFQRYRNKFNIHRK